MIFVNFKTYPEILRLAEICLEVEKETGVKIYPVIKPQDLFRFAKTGIAVWLQSLDESRTGAKGVILNHSDHPLALPDLQRQVEDGRRSGLKILVCADSLEIGREAARLRPDYLAFEPPELIGGSVSVSSAKPEIIADFVKAIPGTPILAGAGINSQEDVAKARKLGAVGILVSNFVVNSENPKEKLLELAKGFK